VALGRGRSPVGTDLQLFTRGTIPCRDGPGPVHPGERRVAWMSRFRRLARDYERRVQTLYGWPWLAFSILMTAASFYE